MSQIIYCGVDFHSRQQTICCLKIDTGELANYELKHDAVRRIQFHVKEQAAAKPIQRRRRRQDECVSKKVLTSITAS